MRFRYSILIAFLFAFALGQGANAQTNAMPPGVKSMKMGSTSMLTDAKGMTLYVYDPDTAGKSVCNGPCAQNWPPLAAPAGAKPVGGYTVITRDDGTAQWALNGKPLYYWKNDKQPGDMTGDGIGGKWHVAQP
jgi:predicted lipoprotein with Yx(FWY)xxD motif